MTKFEEQEVKKIRLIIVKWFDWLIDKNVMGKKPEIIRDKLKDKIIRGISRLFQTKEEERKKKKHNSRINKGRINREIRTLFETGKVKEKNKNKKAVKDNISRHVRILFEQEKEEDYYD